MRRLHWFALIFLASLNPIAAHAQITELIDGEGDESGNNVFFRSDRFSMYVVKAFRTRHGLC